MECSFPKAVLRVKIILNHEDPAMLCSPDKIEPLPCGHTSTQRIKTVGSDDGGASLRWNLAPHGKHLQTRAPNDASQTGVTRFLHRERGAKAQFWQAGEQREEAISRASRDDDRSWIHCHRTGEAKMFGDGFTEVTIATSVNGALALRSGRAAPSLPPS